MSDLRSERETRRPEAEWQPVETAPKDGTDFLMCHAETGDMMVVFYDEPSADAPDHCWHRMDGLAYHRDFPTHWMPLPKPPMTTPTDRRDEGEAVAQWLQRVADDLQRGRALDISVAAFEHAAAVVATLTRQLAEARAEVEEWKRGNAGHLAAEKRANERLAEARAVIERLIEQCAQTSESWHPMLYAPEHGGSHPADSAYRSAREGIARAIRALSATMGTTK